MTISSPDQLTEAAATPVTIPGAVQHDMTSAISRRTYRIFISKPAAPRRPPAILWWWSPTPT
jgi:hypothetical protein